ncbi:MAG: hypothetical protein LBT23_07000, partial [Synergistaceae bacterium]|nr:hypothetical protein [Synergistaceae bacterium]
MISSKLSELEKAIIRYPDVSPFVILKLSMILHGVELTPRALDEVQSEVYNFGFLEPFFIDFEGRTKGKAMPGSILLRDATNVYINYGDPAYTNPYHVDWSDAEGVFLLMDRGETIDSVDFVPRPGFFGKRTDRGVPMEAIAGVRTQKLFITAYQHCRLWETGYQCKFCAFFTNSKDTPKLGHAADETASNTEDWRKTREMNQEDIYETVREALKERGRFSEIQLSGGLDYGGNELFDNEVDRYIRVLRAIGRNFKGRFSSQLMAPAYSKKQVKRLYDETGLTSYCPNIEVWDEEKSKWLCPGKNKWVGRQEWINRTIDAVEIFGKGFVCTQVVAGAELASPHGFKSIDEA